MPRRKAQSSQDSAQEPSFANLLSAWVRQGVEAFLAPQRILLDLALRQNALFMDVTQERVSASRRAAVDLTELAGEGIGNFVAAQRILLNLAQRQNEIIMMGVRERVDDSTLAGAIAELVESSVQGFLDMQRDFLSTAMKQTRNWVEATNTGQVYQAEELVDLARESIENFARAQKKFLDAVMRGTPKPASGKTRMKKTELAQLAQQAMDAFREAQRELLDVVHRQTEVSGKAAWPALELVKPLPLARMARDGAKNLAGAQKALLDVAVKPRLFLVAKTPTVRAKKTKKTKVIQPQTAGSSA